MSRLKLRCPSCNKLFVMEKSALIKDIMEFHCNACSSTFFAKPDCAAADQVLLTYLPGQETAANKNVSLQEKAKCPSCGVNKDPDLSECPSCGVVFAKFENARNTSGVQTTRSSIELLNLWQNLTQDYTNEALHQQFIERALLQKNLAFASQQYRKLLEVNPEDRIALAMRNKIINIATVTFVPPPREVKTDKGKPISYFLFVMAILAILSGVFISQKMTVYLGLGLLFMSVAVRILGRILI